MNTAEATQVEIATITDAAALKGSSTSTQFVSDWQLDSNSTNHNVVFEHGLGSIPSSLLLLYSPDRETVYPIQTAWNGYANYAGNSGNPFSIWMDAKTITFSISTSYSLHSWYNGVLNNWVTATAGYWRVIASV